MTTGSAIPSPNVKIIFTKAPFIQYKQLLFDKKFRQYLETTIVSENIFRMAAQKNTNSKNIRN